MIPGESRGACDVFISYSSDDQEVASAICNALEAAGYRCWLAPRNISPGARWPEAIVQALDNCRALLVVLSHSANESRHVSREVTRAGQNGLSLIPVRIEDAPLSGALAYYLADAHVLDALDPPLDKHLHKLAEIARETLGPPSKRGNVPEAQPAVEIRHRRAGQNWPDRPISSRSAGFSRQAIVVLFLGMSLLLGVTIGQRDLVARHPIPSIFVLAMFMVLTLFLAFAQQVMQFLQERWAKSVADWVEAQIQLRVSRFPRHYFRQLRFRHRVLNVRGLRTQGTYTLELEKVFVRLRAAPQNPQEPTRDLLRAEVLPESQNVWDLIASGHPALRCMVMVGPPGSGKTTQLQHLAVTLAQNRQRRYHRHCRAFIPILLFLREHVTTIVSDDPPRLAELQSSYEQEQGLNPPPGWFEAKLQAGKCLVLLDGLDEVADPAHRQKVAAWTDRQVRLYGASRFVITSRPYGYLSNPLESATVLEIQAFTIAQIEQFVNNWYLANEITAFHKDDIGIRQDAARRAEDLMRRLQSTPTLAALSVNPLLLTMIAMVHRYRGTLPQRRAELYAEICDVLLGHWRASKGIPDQMTPAQKRAVLEPLAEHMMSTGKQEMPAAEAVDVIAHPISEVAGVGHLAPDDFLREVENNSGLLLQREAGVYGFAHLTFQEYLAAANLAERRAEAKLIEHVGEPWWHETIRLFVALGDATGVIRACLAVSGESTPALVLAYQCLNEARTVQPDLSEELQRRIVEGLDAEDADRRRLAVDVVFSLRLGQMIRLSDSCEIDTSYMSCAEYQLFIDDELAKGRGRSPDHWTRPHYPKGDALQPVAGIRHTDAVELCKWLTGKARAKGEVQTRFRLPTQVEAEASTLEPIVRDSLLDQLRPRSMGTWCQASPPDVPRVIGMADAVHIQWQNVLAEQGAEYVRRASYGALARDSRIAPLFRPSVPLDLESSRSAHTGDSYTELARALLASKEIHPKRPYYAQTQRCSDGDLGPLERSLRTSMEAATEFVDNLSHGCSPLAARDSIETLSGHLLFALEQFRTGEVEPPLELLRVVVLMAAYGFHHLGAVAPARAAGKTFARLAGTRRGLVDPSDLVRLRDACLDAFWSLVLLQERIQGNLPAWEGIRIVRERSP